MMKIIAVTAIVVFNFFVLLVTSTLAVNGNGGGGGTIVLLLSLGSLWIAAFSTVAYRLSASNQPAKALALAASTLPVGYTALVVFLQVSEAFKRAAPNTPEFAAACQSAGSKYLATPTAPVESIAYDWKPGTYPPQITYIKLDNGGNVMSSQGSSSGFPAKIKYTEGRCCQFEGRPSNGVGPYIRRANPSDGTYYGVTKLTADALVTYKTAEIANSKSIVLFKTVDVSVTDRRDGKELATLRYVIGKNPRRACGATSSEVIDERAFVLRAIGL